MIYLMNKNRIIAEYDVVMTEFGDSIVEISRIEGAMPIGYRNIDSWIESRKAVSHNMHIRRLVKDLGCDTSIGYIRVTHAGSLNDSFWIREDTENLKWEDVSYYRNDFDEVISLLAFEGHGLEGESFSNTIPELSTSGSFPKCWKRENQGIYLYKGGSDGFSRAGFEPYGEVMASEIAGHVGNAIEYFLDSLNGKTVSKSRLFTNEDTGFVPASRFMLPGDIAGIMSYMMNHGFEDDFRAMMLVDAITMNPDRHRGNFGFLVDNDTLEVKRLAPIFDLNLALLPYCDSDADIKNELGEIWPKYGRDFISLGRMMLTPNLRFKLSEIKDMEFTFKGNDEYTCNRVNMINELVRQNISEILKQ